MPLPSGSQPASAQPALLSPVPPVDLFPVDVAADLVDAVLPADLLDVLGGVPLLALELTDTDSPGMTAALERLVRARPPVVIVGVIDGGKLPTGLAVGAPDVLLTAGPGEIATVAAREGTPGAVEVDDVGAALASLTAKVRANPRAAVTLAGLLRLTTGLSPLDGLVAESLAYSTLLAGPEFAAWLARRGPMRHRDSAEPVRVRRVGGQLRLTLNRPEVRNAYDTATRDALVAALRAARSDRGVTEVVLDAAGPAFGSGGDLSQFGTAPDPATAHTVRVGASAAAEIVRFPGRVSAHVHGACVGAGMELPAFADHVVASRDAVFALPELAMGLVPGAGGTVSITRRVGASRTAWLALTGAPLDAVTAVRWGLVDELVEA
ncbi:MULTISPECIES: enoyl-CoA hydratase/isomerase family protein [unclassified Frankia]|uniref:enoyl-CoA hydratase/isomerase family protein n=1 Tax=unclassified Frankia TaxID=2632575 RepID=UPI002AD26583|nr:MULTISPECIES: enoyl-CoA hydratase/isomerase family protein [unclassified Frankia]